MAVFVVAKELEERLQGGNAGCDYECASFDSCLFIQSIRHKEKITVRLTRSK
jgi:hypothetical protein